MNALKLSTIVSVLGVAMIGNAQPPQGSAIRIGSSPDTRISITPINPGDPAASLLSGKLAGLVPASFYLTNSGRPILAVVLLYKVSTTVDQSAIFATQRIALSSFLNTTAAPVVAANARVLVAGSQIIPEAKIGSAAQVAGFAHSAQQDVQRIGRSATVDILIDSVIFSNGEVVGPDTSGYAQELTDRLTAASTIVALFNQAKSTGTSPSYALSGIINSHPDPTSKVAVWQKRFARQVVQSSPPEAFINYLVRLPAVPKLFNTTIGGKQ